MEQKSKLLKEKLSILMGDFIFLGLVTNNKLYFAFSTEMIFFLCLNFE